MPTLTGEISQDAPPVCLLTENPYRLVSLWDIMRPFQAHLFSYLSFMLGQMHQITKTADADHGPNLESVNVLKQAITAVIEPCSYLGMKLSVIQMQEAEKVLDKAVADAILSSDARGWRFANNSIFDAAKRLKDDLSQKMFLSLPDSSARLFASKEPFGFEVTKAFDKVIDDTREAAKCLACERWTATVFHLMRTLEHGLHQVAKNLNVQWPKPWPLELEQWL